MEEPGGLYLFSRCLLPTLFGWRPLVVEACLGRRPSPGFPRPAGLALAFALPEASLGWLLLVSCSLLSLFLLGLCSWLCLHVQIPRPRPSGSTDIPQVDAVI